MAEIKLENVNKTFGPVHVLHDVNIDIDDGEFVVFVGPSGCGKSTLLRLIAGLEEITSGDLSIGERIVNDLPPVARGIAMVFQSYALYPHMNVYGNMAFGLKMADRSKSEIDRRVRKAAGILQLTDLLDRKPAQLSGGQRQRVAIGRAIVREPRVFLFDEPLSNLDAALRVQTRLEIAKLHQDLKTTIIYVTHDQVEAMTLADKIVVLNDGRVEQVGTPLDLYNHPANKFVAGFIGSPKMNFFDGVIDGIDSDGAWVDLSAGSRINVPGTPPGASVGDDVVIGMRPEHFDHLSGQGRHLGGTVEVVERLGDVSYVYARDHAGERFVVSVPGAASHQEGRKYNFQLNPAHLHLFNADGISLLKPRRPRDGRSPRHPRYRPSA